MKEMLAENRLGAVLGPKQKLSFQYWLSQSEAWPWKKCFPNWLHPFCFCVIIITPTLLLILIAENLSVVQALKLVSIFAAILAIMWRLTAFTSAYHHVPWQSHSLLHIMGWQPKVVLDKLFKSTKSLLGYSDIGKNDSLIYFSLFVSGLPQSCFF